jgi:hypothetical protein
MAGVDAAWKEEKRKTESQMDEKNGNWELEETAQETRYRWGIILKWILKK